MKNQSGIKPVGPRILLLPDQIEERSQGGIIKFTGTEKLREELAQTEGTVVDIGDSAFREPPFDADSSDWCAVGDRVIFAKYAGLISEGLDGKKYRIVHDRDIVAIKAQAKGAES